MNITSFAADRIFHGQDYFPYGLDRSGEFTRQQAQLLMDHGNAYQALDVGDRLPVTAEEEQFVIVCQGLREPQTEHEKAWMVFRAKIQRPKVCVSSPLARGSSDSDTYVDIVMDTDF